MLNIIIISLQSVNEWPVFNLKKHIDKHSKITASKDSWQYLIRLLSSKQLLCSLNIWNFYLYNNVVLAMTMPYSGQG